MIPTIEMSAQLFVSINVLVIVVHVILLTVAYLIYLERKISAYIQDRLGPNRVGFDFGIPQLSFLKGALGLGQPLADGLKFLLKEDYDATNVDKRLFTLAPVAIIIPALIGFAVIPWGGVIEVPSGNPMFPLAWRTTDGAVHDFTSFMGFNAMAWVDLPINIVGGLVHVAGAYVNVGVIYLLAVASLGVYGVTLGGWASNNKFSFLGGLRATAQMISYEIPLGTALLAVLLLVGSIAPDRIIDYQLQHGWLIISQPIAAVIFFIAILAEANRAPFDNAEAESELVGGYHTEYSSMRFALFFLAEYGHMVTSCAFFTLLFLGGWDVFPFVHVFGSEGSAPAAYWWLALLKFAVFFGKVVTLICFMMVIRWTVPRLRWDQVMTVAWQAVIPLGIIVVIMTATAVAAGDAFGITWRGTVPMLVLNLVLFAILYFVQGFLPKTISNKRVPMYGSRFYPVNESDVITSPTDPVALEDRPYEGTRPVTS